MTVLERSRMQTVTALEAKNRFGELLDKAQREPVTVTKQGRASVVVVSAIDYAEYDRYLREKLVLTMKKSQDEAAQKGMTEDVLADLLKDES